MLESIWASVRAAFAPKHQTINKLQHSDLGPDHGYATAECICGSRFRAKDGPFMIMEFERWEKEHRRRPEAGRA